MSLFDAMKARVLLDVYILTHWWYVWLALLIAAVLFATVFERENK
jgi:hypothetical protein